MNAQFLVFSSVAAPKPEDGWQAPPEAKDGITLIMIGYYDSDHRTFGQPISASAML
jgi:hypothetical protein